MFKTDNQNHLRKLIDIHNRISDHENSGNAYGWDLDVWYEGDPNWFHKKRNEIDNTAEKFVNIVNESLENEDVVKFQFRFRGGKSHTSSKENWQTFILKEGIGNLPESREKEPSLAEMERSRINLDNHNQQTIIELLDSKAQNFQLLERLKAQSEKERLERKIESLERDIRDIEKENARDLRDLHKEKEGVERALSEAKTQLISLENAHKELEKKKEELESELKSKSSLFRQIGTGVATALAVNAGQNLLRKPHLGNEIRQVTGIDLAGLLVKDEDDETDQNDDPPPVTEVNGATENSARFSILKNTIPYIEDLEDKAFDDFIKIAKALRFSNVLETFAEYVDAIEAQDKRNKETETPNT